MHRDTLYEKNLRKYSFVVKQYIEQANSIVLIKLIRRLAEINLKKIKF